MRERLSDLRLRAAEDKVPARDEVALRVVGYEGELPVLEQIETFVTDALSEVEPGGREVLCVVRGVRDNVEIVDLGSGRLVPFHQLVRDAVVNVGRLRQHGVHRADRCTERDIGSATRTAHLEGGCICRDIDRVNHVDAVADGVLDSDNLVRVVRVNLHSVIHVDTLVHFRTVRPAVRDRLPGLCNRHYAFFLMNGDFL